jgi:dihydroneopterin aldolase
MAFIYLENMEFYSFHGCLEDERAKGNTFLVSVCMEVDTEKAGKTDELSDTVNYQQVYDIVKKEMEIPSHLIEHVAQRIYDRIFEQIPQISGLQIRLSKLNPPLGGKVEKASIEISGKRSDHC